MHQVIARVDELQAALDDPANLWERLRQAWASAEDEQNPRMAEIVRQARSLRPHLVELQSTLRRVLRRRRELVPLDRVQEMDRASMLWMARQPGNSVAERADAAQRVLAIERHENYDTLENRVLHAYLRLAAQFAAQWLREHARARHSKRFGLVESFGRLCRRFARQLTELGVGVATPDVAANYVLLQVRAYREVHEAWLRLLRRDRAEDDLWAWQAETWTDFCALAVTVSLAGLDGATLLAQSPVVWLDEAEQGRRFRADRPLAVFWLERTGLIVEVQPRPVGVSSLQFAARAPLWLRIAPLSDEGVMRRVPIWTPHCFEPLDLALETRRAAEHVARLKGLSTTEQIAHGIILAPMHEDFERHSHQLGPCRVDGVMLGAEGHGLAEGMRAVGEFVRGSVYGGQA
jgi:hypothetical protein